MKICIKKERRCNRLDYISFLFNNQSFIYHSKRDMYVSFTAYMFIIQLNTCIIYNTYICLIIRFFFIFVALNKKVHKKYRYAYH